MTTELVKSLLLRFVRAFVAGAVATMIAVVPVASNSNWQDLKVWLSALALAGIVGGINGTILAIDKYIRST
jgi:hypothetical protein